MLVVDVAPHYHAGGFFDIINYKPVAYRPYIILEEERRIGAEAVGAARPEIIRIARQDLMKSFRDRVLTACLKVHAAIKGHNGQVPEPVVSAFQGFAKEIVKITNSENCKFGVGSVLYS